MLTKEQINWIKQHEWFESYSEKDGVRRVLCMMPVQDTETGEWDEDWQEFDNIDDFRAWAGY